MSNSLSGRDATLGDKAGLEGLIAALDLMKPRLFDRQHDRLPEAHVAFELGSALIEAGVDRPALTFGPTIRKKRPDLVVNSNSLGAPLLIEIKSPHYYTKYSSEIDDDEINQEYLPSLCHAVIKDLLKLHHAKTPSRRVFVMFDDSGQWVRRNRQMRDHGYRDLTLLRELGLSQQRPLNEPYQLESSRLQSALSMLQEEDEIRAAESNRKPQCKPPKEPVWDLHLTPRYWYETLTEQLLCAIEVQRP